MVFWPLSVLSHLTVATVAVYFGFYAFIVSLPHVHRPHAAPPPSAP